MKNRDNKIVELFLEDPLKNSRKALSKQFKISPARVWDILKTADVDVKEETLKGLDERNKEIIDLYEEGMTYKEISKMYNLGLKTIKIIIRDSQDDRETVVDNLVQDVLNNPKEFSLKTLSVKYDIPTTSVERYLKEADIDNDFLIPFIRNSKTKNIPYNKRHKKMLQEIEENKGKYTIKELSQMYDISATHLTRLLSHEGLMVSKKQMASLKREPMLEDLKNNPDTYFVTDLSKKYEINYITATRWIEKADLKHLIKQR